MQFSLTSFFTSELYVFDAILEVHIFSLHLESVENFRDVCLFLEILAVSFLGTA